MSPDKTLSFLVVLFLVPLIFSSNKDGSYISTSNDAFGASDLSSRTSDATGSDVSNNSPEFVVLQDGTPVSSPITLSSNVLSLTVNATDIENDKITIGVLPDTIPIDSVSLSAQQNNTSIISLNATGFNAGTYSFWIILSDDQDNYEREPYAVIVS